jgi:putative transposase
MRPYSEDLRERIVGAVDGGMSRNAAAKHFGVAVSTVVKLLQRWKATGSVKPDQYGGWKTPSLARHEERIRALVAEKSDITIKELLARLAAEKIETKHSTLGAFLLRLGLTRKKRQPMPPSKSERMSPRPGSNGGKSSRA